MIEAIISGLVLAFVSGLTFLAYRHPEGYRRIVLLIAPACLFIPIGYAMFKFGMVQSGIHLLGDKAARTQGDEVEVYKSSVESLNSNLTELTWVLGVTVVVIIYLLFLWFLPLIVGKATPEREN